MIWNVSVWLEINNKIIKLRFTNKIQVGRTKTNYVAVEFKQKNMHKLIQFNRESIKDNKCVMEEKKSMINI